MTLTSCSIIILCDAQQRGRQLLIRHTSRHTQHLHEAAVALLVLRAALRTTQTLWTSTSIADKQDPLSSTTVWQACRLRNAFRQTYSRAHPRC